MAVFRTGDMEKDVFAEICNAQDTCFYCAQPLADGPFIYWHGTHGEIWLHRTCAVNLANHLCTDAHKCSSDGNS